MVRKLIEKIRRRRSWSEPGHGDRAGQIGLFSGQ
jgi:hypothetical protein